MLTESLFGWLEIFIQIQSASTMTYVSSGEEHYNCISALHKSIRGSDDNAAIYYLARMIEGGEDPLFIARRLIVCASEDIGSFGSLCSL